MSNELSNDIWITEVEAINFQSLKHIVVKLVNGSNAFVGESNSGKTALIRAIRWCLLNKPNGDSYITKGEKEATVYVSLSNGKKVERRKSLSGTNLYRIHENGEVIGEYTGFGTNPPPEVIEAHGIVPIAGDIYCQFAQQLEAPFLLSLRPAKRADVLGNMEELKRIDMALIGVNDDIRQNNKNKKELKKTNKHLNKKKMELEAETMRAQSKIEALTALKQGLNLKLKLRSFLSEQLVRLREIHELIDNLNKEMEKSSRIVEKMPRDLEQRINYFKSVSQHTNRLKNIQDELKTIQIMKDDQLRELDSLKGTIEKKVAEFQQLYSAVKKLKDNERLQDEIKDSFSDRVAALNIQPLEKEIGKYQMIFRHIDQLRGVDQNLQETDQIVHDANQQIEKMLFAFTEALQKAEICPTCGQDTHDVCPSTLETII